MRLVERDRKIERLIKGDFLLDVVENVRWRYIGGGGVGFKIVLFFLRWELEDDIFRFIIFLSVCWFKGVFCFLLFRS